MVPDELLKDPEIKELAMTQLRLVNEKTAIELASMKRAEAKMLVLGENIGRFQYIGVVMESPVHNMIDKLESWSTRNPESPIEILLNSPGGSVLDGLALIDYLFLLRNRGHKITIIGTGIVASMAGAILMAADERVLTSRAYLGMHEVSSYIGNASQSLAEDHLKFSKQLQQRIVDLLCSRSSLTKARLQAMWKRKDIYVSAEKALELGLIDRIEDTEV